MTDRVTGSLLPSTTGEASRSRTALSHSALVAAGLFLAPALSAQEVPLFRVFGYLHGRAIAVKADPSWLQGGFGRFGNGGRTADQEHRLAEGLAQLGAEWTPSRYFDVHVQGLGRTRQSGARGSATGLVEAYADGRFFPGGSDEVQLRAGQFFFPTSRENKGELWTSPYSITWSALNSWIGEEVRPVGLDLQWKHGFYVTAGLTAFRNNDTMGALLAWRGWTVGNRLSVYNEVLPLPPLDELVQGSFSRLQRRDGSKPFERDLDGRTGFAGRLRLSLPERANIQLAHLDNRGDRNLYRGEYSWRTRYDQVSAEAGNSGGTMVAAEYMTGSTAMGLPEFAHVGIGFRSGYLLLTRKSGRWRTTVRAERFSTTDQVNLVSRQYDEKGKAYTTALLYDLGRSARAAIELTRVSGHRQGAAESGGNPDISGRSVTVELRYQF